MECHPYYVQQLGHLTWVRTSTKATEKTVEVAMEDLFRQNAIVYQREVDNLSNLQVNFLRALSNGVKTFSATKVLQQYKLGASSNVVRLKQALEKKEIIDTFTGKVEWLDPGFALWFKRHFR
jgi:hypothetical protein